ncbi:putative syntaxin binding protein [Trypanosoma cruzi]|uniref:Putative syntaxin binding protein n=1 Tax=Trypanosoma cruzi TaxID=5693 RepID=A0A2V2W3V0_TRYCR|nr:putative syntaxin binding protein [Trypanosoma cruzi]
MCTVVPTVIVFLRSAWSRRPILRSWAVRCGLRRSFLRGKPDCRCTSIFCARLVAQYWEKRLAEVRKVEQDIAVGHKLLRKNLDGVRHLTRDAAMPRPVRLRLLLLLVAASSTDELTEAKKQQLIREGGLTPEAHLFANLEHVTRRAGSVQRYSTASAQSGGGTSASASNAATDEDPFLKHACIIIETDRNRTLRVGLSLASVQRDHAMRPNGASGGQNSGAAGTTLCHFKGVVAKRRIILIWVVVVGRLPPQLLSA